jgi:hypothetical protein
MTSFNISISMPYRFTPQFLLYLALFALLRFASFLFRFAFPHCFASFHFVSHLKSAISLRSGTTETNLSVLLRFRSVFVSAENERRTLL